MTFRQEDELNSLAQLAFLGTKLRFKPQIWQATLYQLHCLYFVLRTWTKQSPMLKVFISFHHTTDTTQTHRPTSNCLKEQDIHRKSRSVGMRKKYLNHHNLFRLNAYPQDWTPIPDTIYLTDKELIKFITHSKKLRRTRRSNIKRISTSFCNSNFNKFHSMIGLITAK